MINQSPLLLKFHKRWDIAFICIKGSFHALPCTILNRKDVEGTRCPVKYITSFNLLHLQLQ